MAARAPQRGGPGRLPAGRLPAHAGPGRGAGARRSAGSAAGSRPRCSSTCPTRGRPPTSGRRVCVKAGHPYHVEFDPPKQEGVWTRTARGWSSATTTSPRWSRNRLRVYHEQTEPLVELLRRRGLLRRIDGTRDPRRPRPHPCGDRDAAARRQTFSRFEGVIIKKTPDEIDADGGRRRHLVALRCPCWRERSGPESTPRELDEAAERFIRSQGSDPGVQGVPRFSGIDLRLPELDDRPRHPRAPTGSPRGDVPRVDIGVVLRRLGRRRRPSPFPVGPVSSGRASELLRGDRGVAVRRPSSSAASAIGSGTSRPCHPAARGGRRHVGRAIAGRARNRPQHARRSADPQLRRPGSGGAAGGGDGAGGGADGHRRGATPSASVATSGRSTPRTARWPPTLSSHRGHRRRAAGADALARGRGERAAAWPAVAGRPAAAGMPLLISPVRLRATVVAAWRSSAR